MRRKLRLFIYINWTHCWPMIADNRSVGLVKTTPVGAKKKGVASP